MLRTPAWKRYNWRVIWLSLAYAAFLLPAVYGFKHALIPGAWIYVVAVLPALPIVGIFVAIGRYLIEEEDEYVRMLMVRQILWASGFALSVTTIWGFLDNFGLVGHADGYWVVVVWFVGLGIGGIAKRARLNRSGRGASSPGPGPAATRPAAAKDGASRRRSGVRARAGPGRARRFPGRDCADGAEPPPASAPG